MEKLDLTLRETYRARLTELVTSANDLIASESYDVDEISVLIARIKSLQVNLSAINKRLASTFDDEQLEEECQKIVDYDDMVVEVIARLEQQKQQELHSEMTSDRHQFEEEDQKIVRCDDVMVEEITCLDQEKQQDLESAMFNTNDDDEWGFHTDDEEDSHIQDAQLRLLVKFLNKLSLVKCKDNVGA